MSGSKIKDNGGPAFPRPTSTDEHINTCNVYQDQEGMSLRDWFAGQVLAACAGDEGWNDAKDIAEYAYRQADAMLAARVIAS